MKGFDLIVPAIQPSKPSYIELLVDGHPATEDQRNEALKRLNAVLEFVKLVIVLSED